MDHPHHHTDSVVVSPGPNGVIRVAGELDVASSPVLAVALADPSVGVVDLAAVTFIDAAGLRVLLEADRVRARRGGLTLRAPSAPVRRLLELVDVHPTVDVG